MEQATLVVVLSEPVTSPLTSLPISPSGVWGESQVRLTDTVSVLVGPDNGAYPSGNSLLIEGGAETALIDPSVTVVANGGAPVSIDAVINSHGHEDHVAGNGLFASSKIHIHDADLEAARSLDGLLAIYGFEGQTRADFATTVMEEFYYQPRPDAQGFTDGHVFDLGGSVRVEAMHLPGHTRGHSGFVIDDVFFLSDIDLTGLGPYYGDAWSDLDQFDASLDIAREVEANWYVTFHHKGIVEGRARFLEMIDAFKAIIGRRHSEMLTFLAEPRSLEEMAARRFMFRPHVEGTIVDSVERRTAELHLARMIERGEATEVDPGRYQQS
ncbi:MAG: MBL fold metallo-hydrolase [Actinomycetia bacterium]|nr:MBL fold metallo-hydrolase [Actinomycetes bacterium]